MVASVAHPWLEPAGDISFPAKALALDEFREGTVTDGVQIGLLGPSFRRLLGTTGKKGQRVQDGWRSLWKATRASCTAEILGSLYPRRLEVPLCQFLETAKRRTRGEIEGAPPAGPPLVGVISHRAHWWVVHAKYGFDGLRIGATLLEMEEDEKWPAGTLILGPP